MDAVLPVGDGETEGVITRRAEMDRGVDRICIGKTQARRATDLAPGDAERDSRGQIVIGDGGVKAQAGGRQCSGLISTYVDRRCPVGLPQR